MILAIETSCDDTCAAVVTRDGEIRSNVVSSQGVHERFGGVVPEWASRHHLETRQRRSWTTALDDGRRDARRRRADRGHAGTGARRRAAGRRRDREGARRGAAAAAGGGRPPAGPRRRELPRGRLRAAVHLPAGQRRPHAAGPRHRPPRLRDARPDARRRRRRGVRQGRAAARARLSGRAGAVEAGADRRSGRVQLPDRGAGRGPRLLVRRPEDRAAVQGPRPRAGGDRAAKGRPGGELRARDRRGADRARRARAGRGSRAAAGDRRRRRGEPPAARARAGARRARARPAARAVHRQRRDDRLGGPVRDAGAVPGLPGARRVRDAPRRLT